MLFLLSEFSCHNATMRVEDNVFIMFKLPPLSPTVIESAN